MTKLGEHFQFWASCLACRRPFFVDHRNVLISECDSPGSLIWFTLFLSFHFHLWWMEDIERSPESLALKSKSSLKSPDTWLESKPLVHTDLYLCFRHWRVFFLTFLIAAAVQTCSVCSKDECELLRSSGWGLSRPRSCSQFRCQRFPAHQRGEWLSVVDDDDDDEEPLQDIKTRWTYVTRFCCRAELHRSITMTGGSVG